MVKMRIHGTVIRNTSNKENLSQGMNFFKQRGKKKPGKESDDHHHGPSTLMSTTNDVRAKGRNKQQPRLNGDFPTWQQY